MIRRTATRSLESRCRGESNHAIESVGVVVDHGGRKVVQLRSSDIGSIHKQNTTHLLQNLAFATRSPMGVSSSSLSRRSGSTRATKSPLHVWVV
ncbi:hypothetical protein PI125_g25078 [Phytophthora idaei]|nr:hypothetical protein PI125_g25078 [Phytophthora idaei]